MRLFKRLLYTVDKIMKPKVLIIHKDCPQAAIDKLSTRCEVIVMPLIKYPAQDEVLDRIKTANGIDAILYNTIFPLDKRVLDAAGKNLRIISAISIGVDHLDVAELKSRGILLSNTSGIGANSVAETAILLALAASRRLHEGRKMIEHNSWKHSALWMLGHDIAGSTVGIVGLGGIGQLVAKKAQGLDAEQVLYTGPKIKPEGEALNAKFVSFDELLMHSDFIIVTCPLTEKTQGMFDEAAFKKMKKTSVFVNVARGGIVVQEKLIKALKDGTIFAAGLDVMTPEPLPDNHELLTLPNCVVLPHIGSATVKTRTTMALQCVENIFAALDKKPLPNPV